MRFPLPVLLAVITLLGSCAEEKSSLKKMSDAGAYPSGSALAYMKDKVYLMGDDASYLLVTDTTFNKIDTIQVFPFTEKRIPKDIKKDPEGLTIITQNDTAHLLMIGSGSAGRLRNFCWLINTVSKHLTEISLDTFFDRLRVAGIKDLNIEGITAIPGGILMVSRGNKTYPKNQLIFTTNNFWEEQTVADIHIANIGIQQDTASFAGVSGLDYSFRKDILFLTVSTENTYNAYEDGAIGKSYLWIVKDLTLKRTYSGINPFKMIDLESIDPRFEGHKVESVAIVRDIKNGEELVFVSDNDKGGSILFRVDLVKGKD